MNPIEKLMAEHQNILGGLDVLEYGLKMLEEGVEVSPKFFARAVDFIRNYADKYHHSKEEDILFVRMSEVGFSPEMGPISIMLFEHDQSRSFVTNLDNAQIKYANGVKAATKDIISNSRAYINLLRQHIRKEDIVLYPMAENALGESGIDLMKPEFDMVEKEKAHLDSYRLNFLSIAAEEKVIIT